MTSRWQWPIAAAAAAAATAVVVLQLDDPALSVAALCAGVAIGLLTVLAGLVTSARGEARIGTIVVLAGAAWLVERLLQAIPIGSSATAGVLVTGLWAALLAHAIVSFPSGRLASRLDRTVVVGGYLLIVGPNLSFVHARPSLHDWLGLAWAVALVGLMMARAIAASPAARRAYGIVWAAGIVLGGSLVVMWWAEPADTFPQRGAYGFGLQLAAAAAALALTASPLVAQYAESRFVALVADLETVGPGATLRNALRRSLSDPDLDVAYLRAGSAGWIDEIGQGMTAPVAVQGRAVTPIERGGKPIAALVHDPVLLRHPQRLRAAIGAASLAFDNEQAKAVLRAELGDLRASRARIVESVDRERRRAERNLHDGAQQRLVGLSLMLRLAGRKAEGDPAVTALLAEAAGELDDALGDLRELARGLHPAIVTAAGLSGALETLAERPGLPIDLHVDLPGRMPDPVETGAYYLVAEAVANANKHAGAEQVFVRAVVVDEVLMVSVVDDGRGGAEAAPGSGLEGLADRVSALGGRLVIESLGGHGTRVEAAIPLTSQSDVQTDQRRMTALRWVGWELFEIPGEAYEQLVDEDNLNWVRGMFACAGGAGMVTRAERDWAIGYQASSGTSAAVIEILRTYDIDDRIEDIVALPSMQVTGRGLLYDTLRMCASDGDITPGELERVVDAADRLNLARDVVVELHDIVTEELALRRRRYSVITAPVLPTF